MTPARLAPLLSAALLGGEWTPDGLEGRAARLLDVGPATFRPLVAATLRTFHAPPRHELSTLTAFLLGRRAFWRRLERTGFSGRAAVLVPAIVAMEPSPPERGAWGLPVLDTERDVADLLALDPGELDWFGARLDAKPWHGDADHYRYLVVAKNLGARLLEAPMARLKEVQRRLLRGVLDRIPPHPAAAGFVRGRSIVDHARPHAGRGAVVCFDLEDFFASVTAARVFGLFHGAGYPEAVSRRLAELCTHRTPPRVLRRLPPPASHADAARLHRQRERHRAPHLPQGAPTSPAVANLVAFRLDRRLAALAAAVGASYTRYADDLAFSGDADFARDGSVTRLARGVESIVREEGFRLNPTKTRRMSQGVRQVVCGVTVNAHVNLSRDAFDLLKATLHNCVRHGAASQNREGVPDFRSQLLGRIAWAEQLNPVRGTKLRRMFERIVW